MPPKKRKGKKKRTGADGELTVDDKHRKTVEEIEALKDHLAVRKEYARRSEEASAEWKERMKKAELSMEEREDMHRAVGADMTRQYKTMQSELGLKVRHAEDELALTRAQLERTQQVLQRTRDESERIIREKDLYIETLNLKVNTMCVQYESLLNDYMDRLVEKMSDAQIKWESQSDKIQERCKKQLLACGFSPLDV